MAKPFRERNPVIIGAVSILALVLLLLAAFRAQDLPLIGGGDTYYADFAEAGGLKSGDEVRIAGVRVGDVEKVALDGAMVKVTFRVKTDVKFGDQTAAAIQVKTLLGDMFVALIPSDGSQLSEGSTIPMSRTSSPYDAVKAFSGLASVSSKVDTDQLAKSLTTLADLTRNTPQDFKSALSGISRLSTTIASRSDRINTLLVNLQRVSTTLDARDGDIVHLMRSADVLFRAVVARREQIHRVLVSTANLADELTKLVRGSRADLKPALSHLGNVLDVLNKNQDNLDNSIRLLAPFYRVFASTLGTGPWFDTYISNLPPVPSLTNGGIS